MIEEKKPGESELNLQQILTIMTTEHYTLQMGRGATISDANGRASLFLSTLSGVLVALGFVGQVAKLNEAFFLFALVLLPSLFFLGIATFVRLLESAIEDMMYMRGINRIRHYYLELAPQIKDYFVLSGNDDSAGMMRNMGFVSPRFQTFLTNAGMISVINSVVIGVLVGLILGFALNLSLWVCVLAGLLVFGLSLFGHNRYETARWQATNSHFKVLFPSPTSPDQQI